MIERLSSDSRRVARGTAFFAWRGDSSDGRSHIAQAVERGCAAVVWEREGFEWNPAWTVPNAPVRGLKSAAGGIAHTAPGRR